MDKWTGNTTVAVRHEALQALKKIAGKHDIPQVDFLSTLLIGMLQYNKEEINDILTMGRVLMPFIKDGRIDKAETFLLMTIQRMNERSEDRFYYSIVPDHNRLDNE